MRGAVYRLFRRCKQRWNVSALEPGEKVYLCPRCERGWGYGEDQRGQGADRREEAVADAPSEPIPGQRRKRNGIYPGWDSPEKIQQCLHCTNPDCSGRCPSKSRKKVGRPRIPMPEDFPEKEKLLRYHELIDHYGVNTTVITRWKKELRGKGEK